MKLFFWKRRGGSKSDEPPLPPRALDESIYPKELETLERQAIANRREAAGLPAGDPQVPIGLACSGGGIRSATVCLGVFQALARAGLLRRIDFLSTVSGGGYAGTFLGQLYLRSYVDPARDRSGRPSSLAGSDANAQVGGDTPADRVSRILGDSGSKPIAWLRENGRYLSPNGSGDSFLAAAAVLRNWAAIQLVLIVFCATVLCGFLAVRTLVADAVSVAFRGDAPHFPRYSALGEFFSNFDPTLPHTLWVSDYLLVAGAMVAVLAVPVGLAYWLTRAREIVIAILLGLIPLWLLMSAEGLPAFLLGAAAYWLLAAAAWTLFAQRGWRIESETARWKQGNFLNRMLARFLFAAAIVAAIGVVDSLGQNLHAHPTAWNIARVLAMLATLLTFGKKVVPFISNFTRGGRPTIPVSLLAGIGATALVLVLLAFLSRLTYDLNDAMAGAPLEVTQGWTVFWSGRFRPAWIAFGGFAFFSVILGHALPFLNRSSLQSLYSARLTRAYLGASNPERWEADGMRVTDPMPGDAVGWEEYRPERFGGPLHLINTTINETVDGRSQVEQRDRKGTSLAVGPFGLSAGAKHHGLWTGRAGHLATGRLSRKRSLAPLAPADGFRVFATKEPGDTIEVEPLTLGEWVGISGAAFSTGVGFRTSLGLSLLCGMANVRLGYWWNSGVDPWNRDVQTPPGILRRIARRLPLFPVQRLLVDELVARFPGTALKWWYLTDGGHFENTAAYELIRRRVPLIVILDNGADPDCQFEDMGNLVRKARLDFQTEIRFAGEENEGGSLGVARDYEGRIGTLAQLKPAAQAADPDSGFCGPVARRSERHIAAGIVEYPDGQRGLLLVVKPTLAGDEPSDVLQYATNHPTFPQEPTTDQFFDEAQWESYRSLGEHVGGKLAGVLEALHSVKASSVADTVVT
ncbi:MAG TPA: hypothetical protein VKG01_15410 [Thermoanaerobaculia bacterium]|nr:hypothetical protein [Thermoanaerobaculia bacterium]